MEDNENGSESVAIARIEPVDGIRSVVEGEVSQQVATAKRFPRDLRAVHGEVLTLATSDEDTAASCFYAVPRGGKQIEGASIRMAEILASSWGNMRIASRIVGEDQGSVTCEALAWDLQKNVCISEQVARKLHGKKDRRTGERLPPDADEITLAKMSGQAIARRNAIIHVIPGAFVRSVMEEVRNVAIGKAETLPLRRGRAVEYLGKMGVPKDRVLRFLGRESLDDVTGEDVLTLRGMAQRIKDGEVTADEAFSVADSKAKELDEKLAGRKPADAPKEPSPTDDGDENAYWDWQLDIPQADTKKKLAERVAAIEKDKRLSDAQRKSLLALAERKHKGLAT